MVSKQSLLILVISLFASSVAANEAVVEKLSEAKEKLSKTSEQSRNVMGTLYDINLKMKRISRRRDILNNRLISVQGNVKTLELSTEQIAQIISKQRAMLSKKLRTMYMIGDQSAARAVFSSSSAHELEKFLKYLRRVSNQDYRVIKSYEKNLSLLNRKKAALGAELKKLAQVQSSIKNEEVALADNQRSKTRLLSQLEKAQETELSRIKGLRARAERVGMDQVVRSSLFEKKGELAWPVTARLSQGYGLIEDREYNFRLAHKGLSLASRADQIVTAVHSGVVRFIGEIEGYGKTLILDHDDHFYTVYANLKDSSLKSGDRVISQQELARTSGPLYFEIRHFSDSLDPLQWLQPKGQSL